LDLASKSELSELLGVDLEHEARELLDEEIRIPVLEAANYSPSMSCSTAFTSITDSVSNRFRRVQW
jgi:hypothetical protein